MECEWWQCEALGANNIHWNSRGSHICDWDRILHLGLEKKRESLILNDMVRLNFYIYTSLHHIYTQRCSNTMQFFLSRGGSTFKTLAFCPSPFFSSYTRQMYRKHEFMCMGGLKNSPLFSNMSLNFLKRSSWNRVAQITLKKSLLALKNSPFHSSINSEPGIESGIHVHWENIHWYVHHLHNYAFLISIKIVSVYDAIRGDSRALHHPHQIHPSWHLHHQSL